MTWGFCFNPGEVKREPQELPLQGGMRDVQVLRRFTYLDDVFSLELCLAYTCIALSIILVAGRAS